jgi:hypothetical protein
MQMDASAGLLIQDNNLLPEQIHVVLDQGFNSLNNTMIWFADSRNPDIW